MWRGKARTLERMIRRPLLLWLSIATGLLVVDLVCLVIVRAFVGDLTLGHLSGIWGHLHWLGSTVSNVTFPGPPPTHQPLPFGGLAVFWAVTIVQWCAVAALVVGLVVTFRGRQHAL
jgi:hypothetical protein